MRCNSDMHVTTPNWVIILIGDVIRKFERYIHSRGFHLRQVPIIFDSDGNGGGPCVQVCREGATSFLLHPEVDFGNNLIAEVEAVTDTT